MRELSLFSGAGGGLLGTKLLGWTHVGYVEWNEYCQRVIAARIADGYLERAPIFTDVREFAQSGAADQYRGIADVVSAGFPCQPFSVAGSQRAANDERNMWPATVEVIRRVQPRSVLLENVPGLVSCGYVGTVLADLAALGYVGAGEFWELETLALRISVTASGSWPTPRANQAMAAAITPESSWNPDRFPNLETVVGQRMWPTPTAHNAQECASPSEFGRNTPTTLAAQAAGGPLTLPMILNPVWVEWLQGWPMGWTDLKPLATANVAKWSLAHGGCSHEADGAD
jgi:DNA (cytosine-5)-methyltransferase 1